MKVVRLLEATSVPTQRGWSEAVQVCLEVGVALQGGKGKALVINKEE